MKDGKATVRVLQIPGKMDRGGVSSVLMNYYRHIDSQKVQFDFAVNKDCTFPQEKELREGGCQIWRVSSLKHIFRYMHGIYKIIKSEDYDIVHAHMNSLNVFPLCAAALAGAKVRISHSHSTDSRGEPIRNLAKRILRIFSTVFPTHFAACSVNAAEWLYGKRYCKKHEVTIIRNGIEWERFCFQKSIREHIRKELHLENKFVIGNVGRFVFQKNHNLLLDIFAEYHRQHTDALLLLVGEGELQEEIRRKAEHLGIAKDVIFTGAIEDTSALYQAMDIFILPSRYEGFPVTAVEAQANGLWCILSEAVPEDALLTEHTVRVKDYQDITGWTEAIERHRNTGRCQSKADTCAREKYDIQRCVEELEYLYKKWWENSK